MNAIRTVFSAFANLANAVNGLASVIDAASGRLRQQLAEGGEPSAIIDHQPLGDAESNGEVLPTARGRRK